MEEIQYSKMQFNRAIKEKSSLEITLELPLKINECGDSPYFEYELATYEEHYTMSLLKFDLNFSEDELFVEGIEQIGSKLEETYQYQKNWIKTVDIHMNLDELLNEEGFIRALYNTLEI